MFIVFWRRHLLTQNTDHNKIMQNRDKCSTIQISKTKWRTHTAVVLGLFAACSAERNNRITEYFTLGGSEMPTLVGGGIKNFWEAQPSQTVIHHNLSNNQRPENEQIIHKIYINVN